VSYSLFGFELRHYLPETGDVCWACRGPAAAVTSAFFALSQPGGDRSVAASNNCCAANTRRFVDRHRFASTWIRNRVDFDILRPYAHRVGPISDVGRVFHQIDTNPLSAPSVSLGSWHSAPFVVVRRHG
jgi:hypothetical protein